MRLATGPEQHDRGGQMEDGDEYGRLGGCGSREVNDRGRRKNKVEREEKEGK
jgi:hypothetical protein